MADSVTTQILMDGKRNAVLKFTNISDGTGESAVAKVALADLSGPPTKLSIERVIAMTNGMSVDVLWDATTDVLALHIPDLQCADLSFRDIGGLPNNAGAGVTGSINFTTVGHAAADRYTIILWLKKD
jgi:hypothetical protein